MNKCSPSLSIKEVHMKTTLRFYLTPFRVTTIKNTTNNKCWWEFGEKEMLTHCWWECKPIQPLWKARWKHLKKINIDLPYDPAIPLLRMYPKEWDSGYSKGTWTPMFIVALFTITKIWKQPRCSKIWYLITHNGIVLSHKKECSFSTCK
jgi:hypothetical protein